MPFISLLNQIEGRLRSGQLLRNRVMRIYIKLFLHDATGEKKHGIAYELISLCVCPDFKYIYRDKSSFVWRDMVIFFYVFSVTVVLLVRKDYHHLITGLIFILISCFVIIVL